MQSRAARYQYHCFSYSFFKREFLIAVLISLLLLDHCSIFLCERSNVTPKKVGNKIRVKKITKSPGAALHQKDDENEIE